MWTVNVDKAVDKPLNVGGWRLLMDIDSEERVIFVYMLASRGDVYKK